MRSLMAVNGVELRIFLPISTLSIPVVLTDVEDLEEPWTSAGATIDRRT